MRHAIRSRHVQHLLPRYFDGQLRPRQAQRVYQHLQHCERCRSRAACCERTATDLNHRLHYTGTPGSETLTRIWQGISLPNDAQQPASITRRLQPVSLPSVTAVLLVTASLLITSYSPVVPRLMVQVANTPALSQPTIVTNQPIEATQPAERVTSTNGAPTPSPDAVTTPGD